MKVTVDIYKKFRLPIPTCGLINKITSPKGIRVRESETYTSYRLHTDLVCIYDDRATQLDEGIYWVMNVCKVEGTMQWDHYLFVVEEDRVYPVAEFLYLTNTEWIPEALPYIKKYFAGEHLDPIKLTYIRQETSNKTRWSQVSR